MDGRPGGSLTMRLLAGATVLAVTGGACATKVTPKTAPQTAEECRACNGIWGRNGLSETPSCNCRTHDGGKRCRDGDDCEGMCLLLDDPEREIVEAGPPARGYFMGRCSDVTTPFGCVRVLDRGIRSKGAQRLDSPPAVLCID